MRIDYVDPLKFENRFRNRINLGGIIAVKDIAFLKEFQQNNMQ